MFITKQYFQEIMSVYYCRTMDYLLTATTRCISFGRQLLYMKGYDGRPLGHVVFRQLFLFSPPSISHPFYANIRANIRRYKRGMSTTFGQSCFCHL